MGVKDIVCTVYATHSPKCLTCCRVAMLNNGDRTCIKPTLPPTQPAGPYHYISSNNRQQISTSPQPYQKIPVLFIICTTSLSVNQILSVDLITVIFIFHYFLFFIVTSYCVLFLHPSYCIILCYLALWPQE